MMLPTPVRVETAICGNCGQPIVRMNSCPWYHGDADTLPAWGRRGCRAATFDGHGWDDTLPDGALAEPAS
jgi:hypothetical protein